MQVRQQYEFIIFPKVFNVLNFYSKGLYSLQISLTAQQQSTGKIVQGFPYLIQGPDAIKSSDKKARIVIKDNKISYYSQSFFITFSSEVFNFNTMSCFKIELQRKKQYKIWLDFNLMLTSYKITKKQQSTKDIPLKNSTNYIALNSIDQKISVMDKKRLYLNNIADLNTYQRILFSQPDYFSYTDAYIFSMKTATVVRPFKFDYFQFYMSPIEERTKYHISKPPTLKALLRSLEQGLNFQQLKYYFDENLSQFYKYMIEQPIKQYKRLAHNYQHFRAMMMTLNNSTISQQIKIPFLQQIGKFNTIRQTSSTPMSENEFKQLLQQYYQSQNVAQICVQIIHVNIFITLFIQQSQTISKNIKWLFHHLNKLIIKLNYNVFQLLSESTIKQKWQNKQRRIIYHGDIIKQKNLKHVQFLNFRKEYCRSEKIIEDGDLKHPFIMLEGFEEFKQEKGRKSLVPNYVIDNLVIFVHGYQGSDFDLEIAKYNLEMFNSHSYCLMSTSIQNDMDESIEYLGLQLASEVKEHITHSYNSYKRINFVGYSLGGIVIRQCMRHLSQYKQKMNLFISLASPHTGTIDGGNILIKTGIWYLINFQKSKNIKQLHCQFQGNQQENFVLKKLSQCDSLNWFKKFIVVSSQQDSFVPYPSSRLAEQQCSKITKLMCQNIKKRIKKLQRVQVWFDVQQEIGTIDKMLGRKAHIQFLQNKVFLHCLFKIYSNQF